MRVESSTCSKSVIVFVIVIRNRARNRNRGSRLEARSLNSDFGHRTSDLDPRFWALDSRSWVQSPRFWTLGSRSWILDLGFRSQFPDPRSQILAKPQGGCHRKHRKASTFR